MKRLKYITLITSLVMLSGCTLQDGNFVLTGSTNQHTQHIPAIQKATPDKASTSITTAPKTPATQPIVVKAITPIVKAGDNIIQNPGIESANVTTKAIQATTAIPSEVYKIQAPTSNLPLTWYFKPLRTVNIQGDTTPIDIQIQHNNRGIIIFKSLDDDDTHLRSTVQGDSLVIQLVNSKASKAILSLPDATQNVMMLLKGNVTSDTFPASVTSLTVQSATSIDLSGSPIRLQHLYLNNILGNTNIDGVATPYLTVWAQQTGAVNVHGNMNLRELDSINTGDLSFYLINSPLLTIHNHQVKPNKIFLSGSAGMFNFDIHDSSKLDARYVRAQKGFVKTTGHSQASVTVMDSLNTLATEYSNIYYYHQPKLIGRYFRDQGSVLYLGETPPPCTEAYCPTLPQVLPG